MIPVGESLKRIYNMNYLEVYFLKISGVPFQDMTCRYGGRWRPFRTILKLGVGLLFGCRHIPKH